MFNRSSKNSRCSCCSYICCCFHFHCCCIRYRCLFTVPIPMMQCFPFTLFVPNAFAIEIRVPNMPHAPMTTRPTRLSKLASTVFQLDSWQHISIESQYCLGHEALQYWVPNQEPSLTWCKVSGQAGVVHLSCSCEILMASLFTYKCNTDECVCPYFQAVQSELKRTNTHTHTETKV